MFGLGLVDPIRGFPADFLVIMPMHTAEQRSLPRILANAVECTSVALSGEGPITALGVTIRPSLGELFLTDWRLAQRSLSIRRPTSTERATLRVLSWSALREVLRESFSCDASVPPPAATSRPPCRRSLMAPCRGIFKPAHPQATS
jgi:hypothetical protein